MQAAISVGKRSGPDRERERSRNTNNDKGRNSVLCRYCCPSITTASTFRPYRAGDRLRDGYRFRWSGYSRVPASPAPDGSKRPLRADAWRTNDGRCEADVLVDSGPVNGFAQDRKDHHTGKLRPAIVEEHDVRCGHFSRPVVEVTLNLFTSRPADRYEALFVALARHADITFSEKKGRPTAAR